MTLLPPNTQKFVQAVRRRLALIRLLESVGIASLIASGLGAILVGAIAWRRDSGLTAALGTLTLGIIAGLIWGLTRLPTTLAAAAEADRQLGLADLLATVLLCDSPNDPWAQAVAATAEQRCANLRPTEIILARFGRRAWGGVGLSAALLLTLALLTARPADLRAESQNPAISPDAIAMTDGQDPNDASQLPTMSPSRPQAPGGTDEDSNRQFEIDRPAEPSALAAGSQNQPGFQGASDSGAGDGLSITPDTPHRPDEIASASSATDAPGSGPSAAGGRSDPRAGARGKSLGETTSSGSSPHRAPAWHSNGKAPSLGHTPTNGNVPDWAADLVRDYFQRD